MGTERGGMRMFSTEHILECLDGMIYICDMDTYELLHMNEYLRESLHIQDEASYQGKPCYQVLQGRDRPCDFCNNHALSCGRFHTWYYRNDLLGRNFLIKDTKLPHSHRNLRLELAFPLRDGEAEEDGAAALYPQSDRIINECLQRVYAMPRADQAIEELLGYLGEVFGCDRVTLCRVRDKKWVDTAFGWCRTGTDCIRLQNEPVAHFSGFCPPLRKGKLLTLADVENIRGQAPAAYALLKSRRTAALVAAPVFSEGELLGVIALENPDWNKIHVLTPVLQVISYYVDSLLRRHILLQRLETMSYRDLLTGALNRNALSEYYHAPLPMTSVGVIFCDVSGLKQINDTQGHEAGDRLIMDCYELIRSTLETDRIYRIGGDEFVALCCDCTKAELEEQTAALKQRIAGGKHHIAVGSAWSDTAPLMVEPLLRMADKAMYQDKKEFYSTRDSFAGLAGQAGGRERQEPAAVRESAFQAYIGQFYFDPEALLESLTVNNTEQFFYFGDLRENVFYISDQMRDRFGFSDNLITNLPHQWEQRICLEEYKKRNSQTVELLFREKRRTYELLHPVEDVHGNRLWVHNTGVVRWNADQTAPLFLTGHITLAHKDYAVDPISGFQMEYQALLKLEELAGQSTAVIGFRLNHFAQLNAGQGTYQGNMLLYHISRRLRVELGETMSFYRLEGVHFLAIVAPEHLSRQAALLEQLQEIIRQEYHKIELFHHDPASFAVLNWDQTTETPQAFLETVRARIARARHIPQHNFFTPPQERHQMLDALRRDIRHGMENFRIVVQPAVFAETHRLAGGEALLRWEFQGRDVLPGSLLPLLEREHLMDRVDRWVVEQTVRVGARLRDCARSFILSFNVSQQSLHAPDFTQFLAQTLGRYGMERHSFYVELSECGPGMDPQLTCAFLQTMEKLGVRVTRKQFGSVHAAFRAAMAPDTHVLKVDVSLLEQLSTWEERTKYLHSLAYTCHQFDKGLCLTGLETAGQAGYMDASGCDYGQGYHFYRPLELAQLYRMLCL